MDAYRSYTVHNCDSEDFHGTHTYYHTSVNAEVWCWGWTEEDEFYKLIDTEWNGWDEKHYGY